jgi:hypothetical protein
MTCPSGGRVTGGGFLVDGPLPAGFEIRGSFPVNGLQWELWVSNGSNVVVTVDGYAACAK